MHELVSPYFFCFTHPPCLFFPLSLTQHVISPHMTILLCALITSLLIAPIAFLPRPPLPALSERCLQMIAAIDTIAFHLQTEMMCRCCYLL